MATPPPPTSPPARPVSVLMRPVRSSSRMSNGSRPGDSRASDEEVKTSVKVAVRVRPPLQPGDPGFELIPQRFRQSMVHVNSDTSLSVDSPQGRKLFVFDRVFGEDIGQEGVWDYIAESTSAFLQGYNVSVMAYGQSGAGKSFTMGTSGPEEQDIKHLMGIVPRAAAALFEGLVGASTHPRQASAMRQPNRFSMGTLPSSAAKGGEKHWQMKATYVEIYNEHLRDLLIPDSVPAHERSAVTIREDPKGRIFLSGLKQVTITSMEDLLAALNFGSSIRQTDATTINAKSSRSHAVFSLNLVQRKAKETAPRMKRMSMPADNSLSEETITVDSKLHFVDLAGSERLKNTGASGDRAKEGISINAGLASLGKVISQLSARQQMGHISYRDSKLTRLLQDSLGGNAVTYMIACVNPAEFHISETLNTVQYAQRARNIQSKPKIQQISDEADKQAVIDRLRLEINFLRDQLRNSEHLDRPVRGESDRGERASEREIELQNHLLDVQESYQSLTQRHAKLVSDITRAREGDGESPMNLAGVMSASAVERLQRSASLSDAVEQMVDEYEKTIQSLESLLTKTRSTLSATESKLLERETKCTYTETVNEQLQSRLSKLMDLESSTERYLHDLEERMDTREHGDAADSTALTGLRQELLRLREKDYNSEDYISSLEERLAEASQDAEILHSEITRLEHVVERQRSVGKLDNLLHEMEQRHPKQPNGVNGHVTRDRGISNATYKVAIETPIPESDNEDDESRTAGADADPQTATPRASKQLPRHAAVQAAEQSKFVEEKLETVNQELFDLRMEHETTLNDFAQLNSKYEQAVRALAAAQEKKPRSRDPSPAADLNAGARVNTLKTAGQPSSSRSLSSELSSAGSRPASWEHSNSVVHNESQTDESLADRDDGPADELYAQKHHELEELQHRYEELNEKYVETQDEVEELKAEVQKAKMNNPPSPTSNFLRRKSSQNVMSIDRAHRSLAQIGNLASEEFAEKPDIKDQFELHMGAITHELHQRSERVSMLEGEIASVKRELEGKMTIISGLTRERTTMKTQSPVDMSMLSTIRDQLMQSENQLKTVHQSSAAREKELASEIDTLKQSLEGSKTTASANEELEQQLRQMQAELVAWEHKHESALATMKTSENKFQGTIQELEDMLTQVETMRQQKAAELDTQANSMSAAVAAFELDRQKHADALEDLNSELNVHKSTAETQRVRMAELEQAHSAAQEELNAHKANIETQNGALAELERAHSAAQAELTAHRSTIEAQNSKMAELEQAHAAAQEGLKTANSFKDETQRSLDDHRNQIESLQKQLESHQSAVVSYQADLQSMRDTHSAEIDEIRASTTRELEDQTAARIEELTKRHKETLTGLEAQISSLERQVGDQEAAFVAQKLLVDEKAALVIRLEKDKQEHTRSASSASEDLAAMKAKFEQVEGSKSEAEKALDEARAKLEELVSVKDKLAQELAVTQEKEKRSGRLVEELEGQLAATWDDSQQATSRLSLMQTAKDQELAEARAAAAKAQEEIEVLNNRLSQMDNQRGSVQTAAVDASLNGERTSSLASRKSTGPVTTLPSPPPAIPLPPLPNGASTAVPSSGSPPPTAASKETAQQQRIEEQEARIRTIEKHLFAEKQLTATLEEALTDIEKDSKKNKTELDNWKKKCWDAEDELVELRKERKTNRDSVQAIEAEKAGRLKAEKAREALEARMELLNKKKKKSTLNCF